MSDAFWKTRTLEELDREQWESLCDGCGKCCLAKLQDEDTDEILYTSVACRLFDAGKCRCSDYANRFIKVGDCVRLTPEQVRTIPWLPSSCAYRLVAEGKDLPDWHHLKSGSRETIHEQDQSVRSVVEANEVDLDDPEDYLPFILDEEP